MLKKFEDHFWSDVARYAIIGIFGTLICFWLFSMTARQAALVTQQRDLVEKLTNAPMPKVYFTPKNVKIKKVLRGNSYRLYVFIQNNNVPVKPLVTRLLVLDESLDPIKGPIFRKRIVISDIMMVNSSIGQSCNLKFQRNTNPALVVFQIRYLNDLTDKENSKNFFFRFNGVKDGIFDTSIYLATKEEQRKIEQYMQERGIPAL